MRRPYPLRGREATDRPQPLPKLESSESESIAWAAALAVWRRAALIDELKAILEEIGRH